MKLTLIRGLPGSGKTTLAKQLGVLHVEADMYFMRDGRYQFEDGKAPSWVSVLARRAYYTQHIPEELR